MGTRRFVTRIEKWTIDDDPVERVSKSEWDSNMYPLIPTLPPLISGKGQDEWDRIITIAEENNIAHLIDPVCLRDHCRHYAVTDNDMGDTHKAERMAYWDFRSFPIKCGAACGGAADESHVPA